MERVGAAGDVGIVVARLSETFPEHFLAAHPELREAVEVEFDPENPAMILGPEILELVQRAPPPPTLPGSTGRHSVSAGGAVLTWLRTVVRRVKHLSGWLGLALSSVFSPPAARAQSLDSAPPPVAIACSQSHRVQSTINGRTYTLDVVLPVQYCANGGSDTTHYPVLYLLDNFARMAGPYLRFRSQSGPIKEPGLIIVGIGAPPDPPGYPRTGQGGYWRHIDFYAPETAARNFATPLAPGLDEITHTRARAFTRWMADTIMRGKPGEAPVFLNVLRDEILTFVDRTYRTTHDRGLFGFSAGGYFATYVLFAAPDLFERYGMASPVYWWDDYAIFRQEQMFARTHATLPKQIVLTAGAEESLAIADIYRMSATLWDGPSEGMHLTTEVVPGDHYTLQGLWRAIDVLYPIVH